MQSCVISDGALPALEVREEATWNGLWRVDRVDNNMPSLLRATNYRREAQGVMLTKGVSVTIACV